jgi:uncharacterized membrane protein
MNKEEKIYVAYLALTFLFSLSLFIVPLVSFSDEESGAKLYGVFSPLCHQKISRSFCIFQDELGYYISDCTPQTGEFISDDSELIRAEQNGNTGYKFPVCSRDIGLYLFLFFGAVVYPLIRRIEDRNIPPAIYLIIAILPLAIDGTVQFVTDLGLLPFVYESTNMIRFLTGALAGFVTSFYMVPLLINLFSESKTP